MATTGVDMATTGVNMATAGVNMATTGMEPYGHGYCCSAPARYGIYKCKASRRNTIRWSMGHNVGGVHQWLCTGQSRCT
eukprot:5731053-Pyramimonas_sp.AAC.1